MSSKQRQLMLIFISIAAQACATAPAFTEATTVGIDLTDPEVLVMLTHKLRKI